MCYQIKIRIKIKYFSLSIKTNEIIIKEEENAENIIIKLYIIQLENKIIELSKIK